MVCLSTVKHRFFLRQSGTLGLFSSSSQNLPIAKIRDNVYVATALWALSSAYRLFDDDQGRGYELQQSAVKCMRSILFCYMQHADKVRVNLCVRACVRMCCAVVLAVNRSPFAIY